MHFLESIGNILATAISRLQFESELLDTAARLRGIVDTAVDGIITIDERGIVETINPAAERVFGYAAEEVIGHNVSMLMPEPYRSEHDGYLDHYHKTGERRIIGIGREVRGRRKDGSEFPMDLAVSAANVGQRRIFTGLVRDITERKRLEQEILEISDHEQRRIGADLHDDLCQRLAGIRFSCDALRNSLGKIPAAGVSDRVEKIGARVSEAIDRTRMLARGLSPVALEANGLASALQELIAGMRQLFGIDCRFKSKGDIPVTDAMRATHLYRIAQEAINNALKHGRPTKMLVSLERRGGKGTLTIHDNGVGFVVGKRALAWHGIAHDRLPRRHDRRRCHRAIETAPGNYRHCNVPVRQMKKKTAKPAPASKEKRVLIIDDHVMVRDGVAEIIEQADNLSVCGTASTANEGLEALRKFKPDLVLVDITLPGKNGIEFIKDARVFQPNLLILVMSMHDESLYADRVLRAGGRGYIRKQEGGDKLIEAMRRVLRGEIAVSEKVTGRLLEKFSGRITMDSPLEGLSDRELEVFQLIGQGKTMKEIGQALHLSPKTIEVHRSHIRGKLKVTSAAELVAYAARWNQTQGVT